MNEPIPFPSIPTSKIISHPVVKPASETSKSPVAADASDNRGAPDLLRSFYGVSRVLSDECEGPIEREVPASPTASVSIVF